MEAIIDGIFEPTEERLDGLLQEVIRLTSLVGELEKITTIESHDFIQILKMLNLHLLLKMYALLSKQHLEEKILI